MVLCFLAASQVILGWILLIVERLYVLTVMSRCKIHLRSLLVLQSWTELELPQCGESSGGFRGDMSVWFVRQEISGLFFKQTWRNTIIYRDTKQRSRSSCCTLFNPPWMLALGWPYHIRGSLLLIHYRTWDPLRDRDNLRGTQGFPSVPFSENITGVPNNKLRPSPPLLLEDVRADHPTVL